MSNINQGASQNVQQQAQFTMGTVNTKTPQRTRTRLTTPHFIKKLSVAQQIASSAKKSARKAASVQSHQSINTPTPRKKIKYSPGTNFRSRHAKNAGLLNSSSSNNNNSDSNSNNNSDNSDTNSNNNSDNSDTNSNTNTQEDPYGSQYSTIPSSAASSSVSSNNAQPNAAASSSVSSNNAPSNAAASSSVSSNNAQPNAASSSSAPQRLSLKRKQSQMYSGGKRTRKRSHHKTRRTHRKRKHRGTRHCKSHHKRKSHRKSHHKRKTHRRR